uniref:exodeoxyribonuclease III n=1 Tax=Monodelphis domestica TaxID=13616 RepID=A0A5F8HG90_MONDO
MPANPQITIITLNVNGMNSPIKRRAEEERLELGKDIKMPGSPQVTVITLNMNGMNSPIKRRQIAEWIRIQNPTICCLQETHMKRVDTHKVRIKGWSKTFWASTDRKKAGVAIMISDKAKAKIDLIKRDREGNYILLKGTLDNEEISLINMYAPNNIAPKFLMEKLGELKEEIDSKTILV